MLIAGINKMPDLDGLDSIAQHLLFNLLIGNGEPIMLSLMFGPGVNLESLKVGIRGFCIEKDSPTCRTVTATNPLILVDLMEKLRSLRWIDHIFHCDEDWPAAGIGLRKCCRLSPMIPGTEIGRDRRQPEQKLQRQTRSGSDGGEHQGFVDTRVQRDISPKGASDRNASLEDEEIDGKHSCANPIVREFLHHDVEKGHDCGP